MELGINTLDHKSGEITILWCAETRGSIPQKGIANDKDTHGGHMREVLRKRNLNEKLRGKRSTQYSSRIFA